MNDGALPPAPAQSASRLWEVDTLRGLAVVMMVFYHLMWDLSYFGIYPAPVTRGGWLLFARATASLFLLLVGVSMTLAEARAQEAGAKAAPLRQWYGRGLKLLGWGMVISLITWPVLGRQFIAFGVLHLIGTALLLAPLLLRFRRYALALGGALLALGLTIRQLEASTAWLLPLGIRPPGYVSVDYFPLVPWLGFVVLGIALGRSYLYRRSRKPAGPSRCPVLLRPLSFLGRHSLLIYLTHQPVLFAGFFLLGFRFP
ncbi:MAG: DUF1624 domain-containing protein [Firmicutes bacterium]|nr:DUF1624 domain-containing protein [Bacillota bacterium]